MHCRRERGQTHSEARDRGFVLKRHEPELVFPIPAAEQPHRVAADSAFAVIDQRGTVAQGERVSAARAAASATPARTCFNAVNVPRAPAACA